MKGYLKEYKATLKVVGPVFVGSGKELSKKEYFYLGEQNNGPIMRGNQSRKSGSQKSGGKGNNKIAVIDVARFYQYAAHKGKKKQYEDFLLSKDDDADFLEWFDSYGMRERDVIPFMKYELECRDKEFRKKSKMQIMECIKDPYGNPYIPGSSLKGMLRTILLCGRIMDGGNSYDQERYNIQEASRGYARKTDYLQKECNAVEQKAFYTLDRSETEPDDAVNDELSGFIVSDSEPLTMEDVVLCQKVEKKTMGAPKDLNLLRECIKPGTEIHFTITIDETRCHVNPDTLLQAIELFDDMYYENFLEAFSGTDRLKGNVVYLGGGSGYVSKTFIYPLLGKQDGMRTAQNIFLKTLSADIESKHHHSKDLQFGVSPHVLKVTRYNGRELQFGQCELSIQ